MHTESACNKTGMCMLAGCLLGFLVVNLIVNLMLTILESF